MCVYTMAIKKNNYNNIQIIHLTIIVVQLAAFLIRIVTIIIIHLIMILVQLAAFLIRIITIIIHLIMIMP